MRTAALWALVVLSVYSAFGQERQGPSADPGGRLALGFWPGAQLPIGEESVRAGIAGTFGMEYRLGTYPVTLGLDAEYMDAAVDIPGESGGGISSLSAYFKAGARHQLIPRLSGTLQAYAGIGNSTVRVDSRSVEASEAAFGYGVGAGLEFLLTKQFSLGLRGAYQAHSNTYGGVVVQAGTVFVFPERSRNVVPKKAPEPVPAPKPKPLIAETGTPAGMQLALSGLRFDSVFPVFYKYYDSNPIGAVTVANKGSKRISDISLKILIPRFMDVPKSQTVPTVLEPGTQAELDLFVLLNDQVLMVTEGTVSAVKVEVSFTVDGKARSYQLDRSLSVMDRNAMTWDDDRKAASFVTAKDPAVLTFARNVAAMVRDGSFDGVNLNLRTAAAMLESLAAHGIGYVVDPKTPHAELAEKPQAVDFLQFPRQTLEYRAGDCDDLTILYAALLEAVGIPTAFVIVPGHIFPAFSTGMGVEEAAQFFSRQDELIVRDGVVWMPVEATQLKDGFLAAWLSAAKQWRERSGRNQAEFYPIEAAWASYPAVGLPETGPQLAFPSAAAMKSVYQTQMTKFLDREIFPQVSSIQAQIETSGGDPRHINRLGVLYARYGLKDRAGREFEKIVRGSRPFPQALLNLGHLRFLDKDLDGALAYYGKAQALLPDNPAVLLAVARTNHELENYGTVARVYSRLKQVDPALAGKYAYLDFRGEEARRASQVSGAASGVVWGE